MVRVSLADILQLGLLVLLLLALVFGGLWVLSQVVEAGLVKFPDSWGIGPGSGEIEAPPLMEIPSAVETDTRVIAREIRDDVPPVVQVHVEEITTQADVYDPWMSAVGLKFPRWGTGVLTTQLSVGVNLRTSYVVTDSVHISPGWMEVVTDTQVEEVDGQQWLSTDHHLVIHVPNPPCLDSADPVIEDYKYETTFWGWFYIQWGEQASPDMRAELDAFRKAVSRENVREALEEGQKRAPDVLYNLLWPVVSDMGYKSLTVKVAPVEEMKACDFKERKLMELWEEEK